MIRSPLTTSCQETDPAYSNNKQQLPSSTQGPSAVININAQQTLTISTTVGIHRCQIRFAVTQQRTPRVPKNQTLQH